VTLTPVEQAARICEAAGGSFRDALEAHLFHGWVSSGPRHFAMARAVPQGCDPSNPWKLWPIGSQSAWFVWVGVGDPLRLMDQLPYPLPWIGWNRVGRKWRDNHWIDASALRRRLRRFQSAQHSLVSGKVG